MAPTIPERIAEERCPDETALRELLSGEEPSVWEGHLSGCRHCRMRLETLAGDGIESSDLQGLGETAIEGLSSSLTSMLDEAMAAGLANLGPLPVPPVRREEVAAFLLPPEGGGTSLGRVGGLEVLGILGQGAMGVVLRARDPVLRREVAVKVLKPGLRDEPGLARRFFDEARAMAALSHENVVPIHHVAEQQGLPYLVMPLARGGTLETCLRRDGLPSFPEVLRLGRRITRGLAAAHAVGLVHGDVKPDNVLLDARGSGRFSTVWLADFGLARLPDAAGDEPEALLAAGTPGYLAPERETGAPPSQAGDLYALGTLFLTLGPPDAPAWFRSLAERLRAGEAGNRPAAASVLEELDGGIKDGGDAPERPRESGGLLGTVSWLGLVVLVAAAAMGLSGWWRSRASGSGDISAQLARAQPIGPEGITIKGRDEIFPTLSSALNAAEDGDTVILRGREPFVSPAVSSKAKSLTLAGGDPNERTILYLEPHPEDPKQPLLRMNRGRALRLADLEIHHRPPSAVEVISGSTPPLLRLQGGTLTLERCLLQRVAVVNGVQPTVMELEDVSSVVLRDSQFHNTNGTLLSWGGRRGVPGVVFEIERCFISGGALLSAHPPPAVDPSGEVPVAPVIEFKMRESRANLNLAFHFRRHPIVPSPVSSLKASLRFEDSHVQTRHKFFSVKGAASEDLPQPTLLAVSGGALAHTGRFVGLPGIDFPALAPEGGTPPTWQEEPLFLGHTWKLRAE